jgi:hypothetical protein
MVLNGSASYFAVTICFLKFLVIQKGWTDGVFRFISLRLQRTKFSLDDGLSMFLCFIGLAFRVFWAI